MQLTDRQQAAQLVLAGPATHQMLYGGSRCLSGDAVLDGHTATIRELAEAGDPVTVQTTRGPITVDAPWCKGESSLVRVETVGGRAIRVTPDHRFWSGSRWIRADELSAGGLIACVPSPRGSNSVRDPSASREDAPRSTRTPADSQENCSADRRRYDRQPHRGLALGQAYRERLSDALARIRESLRLSCLAFAGPGSGIHAGPQLAHAAAGSRSGRGYAPHSKTDDARPVDCQTPERSRDAERTYAQSQDQLLGAPQSRPLSWIRRSLHQALDSAAFRFCRSFGVSWDALAPGEYVLDKVLSVSQSAVDRYYTLHVPVAEHYAANGIYHHNSGKTFLLTRNVIMRALKAPKSRHAILRFRFNAVKSSVVFDTFPKVMETCFPGVKADVSKTDWFAKLDNGSEIWFGGLDDKERAEKILGMEFATVYLNEASQIPWHSRNIALTRLSQRVDQMIEGRDPKPLQPRMYLDCNPPSKAHWTYRLFHDKIDPETREPVANPADYSWFQINPSDNLDNLSAGYLDTLRGMSARMRARFLDGKWADATPGQLFPDEVIDTWRCSGEALPDLVRVVVAVDPSGSDDQDNADNDAIGIVVAGVGTDGIAYVLEDCTVKAGPATWGRVAASAYDRHRADIIVGEGNYGGAMVREVIRTAAPRAPFKLVTASRGKHVRAEPYSALYEQGKIRHAGQFAELEDELSGFSTVGYTGDRSPNRADALIWALAELFPGMVRAERKVAKVAQRPIQRSRESFLSL